MSTHMPDDQQRYGWAGRLAWGIWALVLALQIAALALAFVVRGYGDGPSDIPLFPRFLMYGPGFIAAATVGALIATRQPRNPVGWLFLASNVGIVGSFAEAYWRLALLAQPDTWPGGVLMLWVSTRPYFLKSGCEMLLVLIFPTGRPLSPRWWLAGWLVIVGQVMLVAAQLLMPGPIEHTIAVTNPFGIVGGTQFLQGVIVCGTIILVIGALATMLSLILRLRRTKGVERQQVKFLAAALVVYMASLAAVGATVPPPGVPVPPAANIAFVLQALASVLVAVAAGVAILRYHLFDIDLIIRRTLVYTVVTALLGTLYVSAVVLLQALFVRLTGQESTLAVVASTLVIAALFQPLRRWVQAAVDRRFDRSRYDARIVLEQFARRAQQEADLAALSADLLATVDAALKPSEVRLWLVRRERRAP